MNIMGWPSVSLSRASSCSYCSWSFYNSLDISSKLNSHLCKYHWTFDYVHLLHHFICHLSRSWYFWLASWLVVTPFQLVASGIDWLDRLNWTESVGSTGLVVNQWKNHWSIIHAIATECLICVRLNRAPFPFPSKDFSASRALNLLSPIHTWRAHTKIKSWLWIRAWWYMHCFFNGQSQRGLVVIAHKSNELIEGLTTRLTKSNKDADVGWHASDGFGLGLI